METAWLSEYEIDNDDDDDDGTERPGTLSAQTRCTTDHSAGLLSQSLPFQSCSAMPLRHFTARSVLVGFGKEIRAPPFKRMGLQKSGTDSDMTGLF